MYSVWGFSLTKTIKKIIPKLNIYLERKNITNYDFLMQNAYIDITKSRRDNVIFVMFVLSS